MFTNQMLRMALLGPTAEPDGRATDWDRRTGTERPSGVRTTDGVAAAVTRRRRPVAVVRPATRPERTAWHHLTGVLTVIAGVALCCAVSVRAATGTSTVALSSNVNSFCTLSAAPMAFAVYSGTRIDTASSLSVNCTNTTTYQIGADNGLNSQFVGVYAKYMAGPSGNNLRYHLYTDSARSIEWGTTAGSNEVAGTGTGLTQAIPVYGTIGAGSYVAPGSYTDTVTFTVNF